jgi:mRNA interferase MazF
MLTSGEVVLAELSGPVCREARFPRPGVVVTAQVVLAQRPNVVHVVPITTTRRGFRSEIDVDPDEDNGLTEPSAAQCQHVRAISTDRLADSLGTIGPAALSQIREILADLLDL